MSHTPGPWIASHDPDAYSDDDYCIGVPDGKVDQVAVCSKRDANLIAAAPDMYAALKELAECSQYWSEYDVPLGIHGRIAAALAKAGA
jgi:hypothetical protein